MNRIKTFSLIMVLSLTVVFMGMPSEAWAQQANVGVFDLQKCLNDSTKGKKARANLESKFKKMQDTLKSREKEINTLSSELRKMIEKKSGDQNALRKKDEELKKKVNAYQELLAKNNAEMRTTEESALKPLVDKAVKLATDYGRQRGYIVVLETQQAGVVYAADYIDMTKDIIKGLDK